MSDDSSLADRATGWRHAIRAALLAFSVAGCAEEPADSRLLTWDPGEFCSLAELLPVRIMADRDASPAIWARGSDGERIDIAWPRGFRLIETDDGLAVQDPDRAIVAREGAMLRDAGGETTDSVFRLCMIGETSYADRP
ncbi:MAG: hypothetical protein ACRDGD_07270 [Candidatus Limnocylindria bacterium]